MSEPTIRALAVPRQRAWSRFLLIALLLHVPVFFYPILRLCAWLELSWWQALIVFLPLASSQIVSRVYLRGRDGRLAVWYRRASDFWLGLSPVMLISLLVFEVIVLSSLLEPYEAALWVLGITAAGGVAGFLTAITPMVKRITFQSPNLKAPVRFVQITDVHIGSRSQRFLEDIIYRVNRLEPDFLCITGDFIDQMGIDESVLVSLRSVACPVYFCIGNHEKYEDLEDIVARLRGLGVVVLRNQTIRHRDDLQVIGIDDMDDPMQVERELKGLEVSRDGFVLLLYHRPRGLESAAEAGVDLMLSGHTHNGQIIPFNLVVGQVFDRIVGMHDHGNAKLYVSQGTGTWGPVMRLGTRSEITLFELSPLYT